MATRPGLRGRKRKPSHTSDSFPICRLFNTRIVNSLPPACPLKEPNPLDGLLTIKDRAYGRLSVDVADTEAGHLFRRHDVCSACVARLLSHPAVKRVRERSCAKPMVEAVTS